MTEKVKHLRGPTPAQEMYDALKSISKNYWTPEQLRKNSEKIYGLPYVEALEMAYENIQQEARLAIHKKRRPK